MGVSIGKLLVSVNHTFKQIKMSFLTEKKLFPGQAKTCERGERILPCWTLPQGSGSALAAILFSVSIKPNTPYLGDAATL
jgi:hypothetical protein